MGRMKENPRYNVLSLRVSDLELKHIKIAAAKLKIEVSVYVRLVLFGGQQ